MKLHWPSTEAANKMDTPIGLFRGVCSCGWRQVGVDSLRGAITAAAQHADAKNNSVATGG